jgi:hypothetical protein
MMLETRVKEAQDAYQRLESEMAEKEEALEQFKLKAKPVGLDTELVPLHLRFTLNHHTSLYLYHTH